jgi:hypothetical protein
MNSQRSSQENKHRSNQMLLALFSFMFVIIIAYGYFHLLRDFGWFVAAFFGGIIAIFAWYLARVAGTHGDGTAVNWILVVPLFLISAAGVYNSMMVFLEGGQVLSDTASKSQQRFGLLENAAQKELAATGVSQQMNKVYTLRDALFSEIDNPLNCGQGPEARRLIAELRRELPGFEPLSSPSRDCSQNQAVVQDYSKRIDDLVNRAPWNDAVINGVARESARARQELADLRGEISKSYSPADIHQVAGIFEKFQTQYQDLRYRLGQKTNVEDIPEDLPIVAAQSLGNVYKLPALILSRIGEASTYVYFIIALGFDLLLVYFFQLAAKSRVRRLGVASPLAGAW